MATTEFKSDVNKVVNLPRSEIFVDYEWNPRNKPAITASVADSSDAPTINGSGGAHETAESIKLRGQDTPVDVFPNPNYGKRDLPGNKFPWALADGFTRFYSVESIEKDGIEVPNLPKGTIRAICHKEMSWQQATGLALRKNTRRNGLSAPDTAYGLARYVGDGSMVTAAMAVQETGMAQAYVHCLLNIMKHGNKAVLEKWRNEPGLVSYVKMETIVAKKEGKDGAWQARTADEQQKGYAAAAKPVKPGGRGAWFEKAQAAAAEIGKLLGTLVQEGHLPAETKDMLEWDDALNTFARLKFVRITYGEGEEKKTANATQRAKITKAAVDAFVAALTPPVDEDKAQDAEVAKAEKAAKKNGKEADAPAN